VPSTPDIRTETSALLDNGPESASALTGKIDPKETYVTLGAYLNIWRI